MIASFRIFLLVAEEMSISRAAERAYVTQQCVSDHIKRLEKTYRVVLFERRPKLALTDAGQIMLNSLRHINILENNLEDQLGELSRGTAGNLTIGVNSTRAGILFPEILPAYREKFPHVVLTFVMDDTRRLEEKLLKGEIDMFVGVNAHANPKFKAVPMGMDHIYLVVSRTLLARYLPVDEPTIAAMKEGVSLADFEHFPFVGNDEKCTLNDLVQQHVDKHNIHLKSLYYTSDYDTQISLCASHLAAAVCPTMVLQKVLERNLRNGTEEICAFPLEKRIYNLRIELIYHKDVRQPLYAQSFTNLLKEAVEHTANTLKRSGY